MPSQENERTKGLVLHRCSTCFEPIQPHARKCPICDSYQDWRRHLQIGSSVLALMVALVSVVALATPLLVQTFEEDKSEIDIAFTGIVKNRAFFMATNSGNRPATITAMRLKYSGPADGIRTVIWAGEPTLVPPGSAKQLFFDFDAMRDLMSKVLIDSFAGSDSASYHFIFEAYALEFNRTPRIFEFEPQLPDLARSGEGPLWRCYAEKGRWTGRPGPVSRELDQIIGRMCLEIVNETKARLKVLPQEKPTSPEPRSAERTPER